MIKLVNIRCRVQSYKLTVFVWISCDGYDMLHNWTIHYMYVVCNKKLPLGLSISLENMQIGFMKFIRIFDNNDVNYLPISKIE